MVASVQAADTAWQRHNRQAVAKALDQVIVTFVSKELLVS
jgi:hypothetical protein